MNARNSLPVLLTRGLVALVPAWLAAVAVLLCVAWPAQAQVPTNAPTRLPGHTLPALARATLVTPPSAPHGAAATAAATPQAAEPITLTVTLNRSDQNGFNSYLAGVTNPASGSYRKFLSQQDITNRFGPSQTAYDAVLAFLTQGGFSLVQGSANRLTLTVSGTRAQVEQAFALNINDYTLGGQSFRANDQDPAVPASIAPYVQGIAGLSTLAQPKAPPVALPNQSIGEQVGLGVSIGVVLTEIFVNFYSDYLCSQVRLEGHNLGLNNKPKTYTYNLPYIKGCFDNGWEQGCDDLIIILANLNRNVYVGPPCQPGSTGNTAFAPAAAVVPLKLGLLEFDGFLQSDVSDWLTLNAETGYPVTVVPVNGGVPILGPGEDEVLLDIDAVQQFGPAGTSISVYEAPGSTTFQTLFNAMLNDPAGPPAIMSNSWQYCEDQTTQADATTLDAVLAQAAGMGISVVTGSGDTGSTCGDGSANTAGVPADSPNITAVGASGAASGVPAGQRWWNDYTGASGFGTSQLFSRPSYQSGLTAANGRSLPDIVVPSSPTDFGFPLCQADNGGCPDGLLNGGTSLAAPEMAAFVAEADYECRANGKPPVGQVNPAFYALASTASFHGPTSMAAPGNDFAHVGLGAQIQPVLFQALCGLPPQTLSTSASSVLAYPGFVPADGASSIQVVVQLTDANGAPLSGSVTLTANPAGAAITPSTPETTNASGTASFTVTDTAAQQVTLTATANGAPLQQQPVVTFLTPAAGAAGITASPSSLGYNQPSIVTVTLTDGKQPPGPIAGKHITLSQGSGHSTINAVGDSSVTDATGKVQFQVYDSANETVTYTAYDDTDGTPVPGSAPVTFSSNPTPACITGTPAAQNGYAFTGYATGFPYNSSNCIGPLGLAFDSSGNLDVINNGGNRFYRFGPGGGIAGDANVLPNDPGPLSGLTYGKDGELYATETNYPGKIVQIDPLTGAELHTVYDFSNNNFIYFCPLGIATDPISGDLFVTQEGCSATNPTEIVRIQNPSSATPTAVGYASTGGLSDGLEFGQDGTLYVATNTHDANNDTVVAISRAGLVTPLADVPGADGIGVEPNPTHPGGPPYVFVNSESNGTITRLDLSTYPATQTVVYTGGSRGDFAAVGRDGCLYATQTDQIIRLTNADGTCSFTPSGGALQLTLSPTAAPTQPPTGSQQTFTASFANVSPPAGTPVTFTVSGANPQATRQVNTDATGKATFTYTGAHAGTDSVVATATTPGGTFLTSNTGSVTWVAGKDVTFITLNGSAKTGAAGQTVPLQATLTDVTAGAPIAGATVTLSLQGGSCQAVTNASGVADCSLTVSGPPGSYPLTASYAGGALVRAGGVATPATNAQYTGSMTTEAFLVAGSLGATGTVDLQLSKTASATATVGQSYSYSLDVTNLGTMPATAVSLVDVLPAGLSGGVATASQGSSALLGQTLTCLLGDIPGAGTVHIGLPTTPGAVGTVTNTATVSTTAADVNLANNTSSATTQVTGAAPSGVPIPPPSSPPGQPSQTAPPILQNNVLLFGPPSGVLVSVLGCGTTQPGVGLVPVAFGSSINIQATPCTGWQFAGWTGSGTVCDTLPATIMSCDIAVPGATQITAVFKQR